MTPFTSQRPSKESTHLDSCSQPSVLSTGRQHSLPETETGQSWKIWVLVPAVSIALLKVYYGQPPNTDEKLGQKERTQNKRCQRIKVVEIQAAERR